MIKETGKSKICREIRSLETQESQSCSLGPKAACWQNSFLFRGGQSFF